MGLKKRLRGLAIICISWVVALCLMGLGYGAWTDSLQISFTLTTAKEYPQEGPGEEDSEQELEEMEGEVDSLEDENLRVDIPSAEVIRPPSHEGKEQVDEKTGEENNKSMEPDHEEAGKVDKEDLADGSENQEINPGEDR